MIILTIEFQNTKQKQIFLKNKVTTLCGSNALAVLELIINCKVCG